MNDTTIYISTSHFSHWLTAKYIDFASWFIIYTIKTKTKNQSC